MSIEDYHALNLREYKKVYSFLIQPIQSFESNGALKPHYFVHPDAPTNFAGKDYNTALRWTVVPGAQGKVEPAQGNLQTVGLLTDSISTHNSGLPDNPMGVSGDVMHLKGLDEVPYQLRDGAITSHIPSKDLYSLVAFEDEQGEKTAAITYHWLLSPYSVNDHRDFSIVKKEVDRAGTLRDLISGLEKHAIIGNLTGELKQYLGYSPIQVKPIVPVGVSQKPVRVRISSKSRPVKKAVIAPVSSIARKLVAHPKTPVAKAVPKKAVVRTAAPKTVAAPVKKALKTALKNTGVMGKKAPAFKVAPKKAPVHKTRSKKVL